MNKTEIMNAVSRRFHKIGFAAKKHSPELLIIGGIVSGVAATVAACYATTKVSGVVEDTREQVDKVHRCVDADNLTDENHNPVEYTEEDAKADLAKIYIQTGVKFVKLYAPAVVLGAVSVGCVLMSHNILRKRNLALAAAYATERLGFKEYRERVIERFGKDLDKELKYNIRAKEVQETIIDEETGEEKTVTRTVQVADINARSQYARFFDETNDMWQRNAEHNLTFLLQQQNYANDLLRARGYVFLNEVYDMLNIRRSVAGQIVGWIYDERNHHDNYIDFGIHNIHDKNCRDFVNGRERSILLDFNVDGEIWNILDDMGPDEKYGDVPFGERPAYV